MSEEIIKVLNDLGQKFGVAIDWSNQNIMPYLQELMGRFIQYRNATGIMQIILWLALLIISVIAIVKLIKWEKSEKFDTGYSDDEVMFWVCITFAIVLGVVSLGLLIGNIFGVIQNIFMPELTIMEYIKTLT